MRTLSSKSKRFWKELSVQWYNCLLPGTFQFLSCDLNAGTNCPVNNQNYIFECFEQTVLKSRNKIFWPVMLHLWSVQHVPIPAIEGTTRSFSDSLISSDKGTQLQEHHETKDFKRKTGRPEDRGFEQKKPLISLCETFFTHNFRVFYN